MIRTKKKAAVLYLFDRTATCCNTLQHTATHCDTLQHTAAHCDTLQHTLQHTATHCDTLRHTATHCNTLQHTYTPPQNTRIASVSHLCGFSVRVFWCGVRVRVRVRVRVCMRIFSKCKYEPAKSFFELNLIVSNKSKILCASFQVQCYKEEEG